MTYVMYLMRARSHVYFKSQEMHGKSRKRETAYELIDTSRYGPAYWGSSTCHCWFVMLITYPSLTYYTFRLTLAPILSVDREIEILQELQERILVHDKAMEHACDVSAELDCLISFASASRSYEYNRPHMTEDNIVDIKQGRRVARSCQP